MEREVPLIEMELSLGETSLTVPAGTLVFRFDLVLGFYNHDLIRCHTNVRKTSGLFGFNV